MLSLLSSTLFHNIDRFNSIYPNRFVNSFQWIDHLPLTEGNKTQLLFHKSLVSDIWYWKNIWLPTSKSIIHRPTNISFQRLWWQKFSWYLFPHLSHKEVDAIPEIYNNFKHVEINRNISMYLFTSCYFPKSVVTWLPMIFFRITLILIFGACNKNMNNYQF